MPKPTLPNTDSIHRLADFWDVHDLTDFEDHLEEVKKPVFVRRPGVTVPLDAAKLKALDRMARAKGVSPEALVRTWVLQHLPRQKKKRTKRAS